MVAVWLMGKGLDCQKCNKQLKRERGCDGYEVPRFFTNLPDVEIDRCPVQIVTDQTEYYLELFELFQQGFLLDDGGIESQSAKYLNVMRLLKYLLSKELENGKN